MAVAVDEELDDLLGAVQSSELRIAFGDLVVGSPYQITQLICTTSNILGRSVPGIQAKIISPQGINMFSYLPKAYVNMAPTLLNRINKDGSANSKWTVVRYGSVGNANVARVHKPGEGVDEDYFHKMQSMAKQNVAFNNNSKRKREDEVDNSL